MYKLSDDYFYFLQLNSFIDKINIIKCDKKKLALKSVTSNYKNFIFPNLNCLELISSSNLDIIKELTILLTLDNICSKIIKLDLSFLGLNDEAIILLSENISKFKKIEQINIQNSDLTSKSERYLSQFEKKKIKITLKSENKLKNKYNIILGGSTIAGKTTYFESFFEKKYCEITFSSVGLDYRIIKELNKSKFLLWDTPRWFGSFDNQIKNKINKADGVILMFDLSKKNDFDELPQLLKLITEFHELKNFPVLLIGNKSDLDIKVDEYEIEKFFDKENFIGYFEVSCKNYKGVEESVDFMINYIYKKDKKMII